jgi:lipid-binding SYLF domain-containing protein
VNVQPRWRLFLWTPLGVLICVGAVAWFIVPSMSGQAFVFSGALGAALLTVVQEHRRGQMPRRILLSGLGAGVGFVALVAVLLLLAFWDFDS